MSAIYKKELKGYFSNMTGYVIAAFIIAITGVFATMLNLKGLYPEFEKIFGTVSFIFLIVIPILTMRSFSEERAQKTDQLLYSLPVSVAGVVMGKFLAMLTVLLLPMAAVCLIPLIMSLYGTVNLLAAYGAVVGFFFLGATLTSVGMFVSSLTESQLISAISSFGAILAAFIMSMLAGLLPKTAPASYIAFALTALVLAAFIYYMTKNYWAAFGFAAVCEVVISFLFFTGRTRFIGAFASFISSLSFFDRLNIFIDNGIFDLTAIVYYLTVTFVFVFLTVQSVEKRRWS